MLDPFILGCHEIYIKLQCCVDKRRVRQCFLLLLRSNPLLSRLWLFWLLTVAKRFVTTHNISCMFNPYSKISTFAHPCSRGVLFAGFTCTPACSAFVKFCPAIGIQSFSRSWSNFFRRLSAFLTNNLVAKCMSKSLKNIQKVR